MNAPIPLFAIERMSPRGQTSRALSLVDQIRGTQEELTAVAAAAKAHASQKVDPDVVLVDLFQVVHRIAGDIGSIQKLQDVLEGLQVELGGDHINAT